MSKLEKILTFIQVLDKNGFAAAGRAIGLSKAAISKQISLLEEELGVKLLNRTTRKLQLTEEGAIYYKQCEKLLESIREMDQLVSSIKDEPSGTLRVASGRYFAEKFILPRLADFIEKYPKIIVHLELAERIPNVLTEELDIVFGMTVPNPQDAIQKKIFMTKYKLCASPTYLKQRGIPKVPRDLIKHRYITHEMRQPNNILMFNNGEEIMLNPILYLNDTQAMKECALNGMGIVKLHDYAVVEEINRGELVEILDSYAEKEIPIYYAYKPSRFIQPKIRLFIDHVLEKAMTPFEM